MKTVIIVKNKLDATYSRTTKQNYQEAQKSLANNEICTYQCSEIDADNIFSIKEKIGKEQYILFVSYTGSGLLELEGEYEIKDVFVGTAEVVCENNEECKIFYSMKKRIDNKYMIINLFDGIEMNITDDFAPYSYVMIRTNNVVYSKIRDILNEPYLPEGKYSYREYNEIYELGEYAQRNNMCKRMYGFLKEDFSRNEFQRDRERIVNSKAFRRLVDKAQVFSAEKGDHYRTRMTHTLEVNQISKAIASCLALNLDLVEAIALAHDLGHTPFGHQGERTIKRIMDGKELEGLFNIDIKDFKYNEWLGGFKHNLQSVRVLTKLEEKYVEYPGLDISFQVLEGALKHTEIKDNSIEEMINPQFVNKLNLEYSFCTNLEGQVVSIADEIAQRGHDIDDAITSGLIDIDELISSLAAYKFSGLHNMVQEEYNKIKTYQRCYVSEKELIIGRVVSSIVGYFINDVVETSKKNIEENLTENENGIFKDIIINFSKAGKACNDLLEKIINKKVIASFEVARFDHNAATIVKKLFEIYYNEPKLLHNGTLRKIYIDTLQDQNENVRNSAVDLVDGNIDVIRAEIKNISQKVIKEDTPDKDVILQKRKILIRNIADYISGMTDTYAIKEYNKFY